jgi:hypothetical protein
MLTDVLDLLLGALRLALLTVAALFLPLFVQLLLLFWASRRLDSAMAHISYIISTLLNLVGTPIHEFSHAIGFLITLKGVVAIKPLLEPPFAFAMPARKPGPVAAVVAALAPLFGGIVALWLTARFILPGFDLSAVTPPALDEEMAASLGSALAASLNLILYSLKMVVAQLLALPWDTWRTYVGLYLAVSIGVGLAPSPPDVKVFFATLPVTLILLYGLFVGVYFLGDVTTLFPAVMETALPLLLRLTMAITSALLLTLLGLVLCIPLFFLKRIVWGSPSAPAETVDIEPVHDPTAE